MKKLLIVVMMVLVPVFFAQAKTETCAGCPQKESAGQEMVKEGCPKKYMKKHKMMIQELMGMMKSTMKIQQNTIQGASKAEKKEMTKELSRMMDRMDTMMSEMKHMTGKGMKCDKPCEGCEKGKKCDKPCGECKKKGKDCGTPAGK